MTDDTTDVPDVRPSRVPLIAAAVVVLAAIGGLIFFLTRSSPEPHRVLVAVKCETGCGPQLSEQVIAQLEALGFDAVPDAEHPAPDGLDAVASLEEALALAGAVDASHAVFVEVKVRDERAGIGERTRFVLLEGHARAATVGVETRGEEQTVTFGIEAASPAEAAVRSVRAFTRVLSPGLVTDLVGSAPVQAFLREPGDLQQMEISAQIERTRKATDERAVALRRYRESCAEADARLTKSPHRCVSAGCAEEYAFGVLPDASAVLVHAESPEPFFSLEQPDSPYRAEVPERLELVPLAGGARRTLAFAGNYYGYPALSPDGRTVVFVEAAGDRHAMVALDVASGRRLTLLTVDWPARVGDISVSPDNRTVLYRYWRFRRDTAAVGVVPIDDAKEELLVRGGVGARWVQLALPAGSAPRSLIAITVAEPDFVEEGGMSREGDPGAATDRRDEGAGVMRDTGPDQVPDLPPGPERRHLAIVDPTTKQILARVSAEDRHVDDVIGVGTDGVLRVSWYTGDQTCGIGSWDPATATTGWIPTEGACVADATLAADGTIVGVAQVGGGDGEIVRVDPTSGGITALTTDDVRQRYPRTAPRSPRIVYEHVPERVYRRLPRVAVCATDR